MLTTVYRVEDANQHGPYQSVNLTREQRNILADMYEAHGWMSSRHLNPHVDPLLNGIKENEFCAFATIEQLCAWFEGFVEVLEQAGFMVSLYHVRPDTVRHGESQILVTDLDRLSPVGRMTVAYVIA